MDKDGTTTMTASPELHQEQEVGDDSDVEIVETKTTTMPLSRKRSSEGPLVRATPAKRKRMEICTHKTDGTRRTQRDLAKLTVAKLKEELKGYGIDTKGLRLKKHYVSRLVELISEAWSRKQHHAHACHGQQHAREHVKTHDEVERGEDAKMEEIVQPQFAAPAPTPRIARRTRSKRRKK